jgi:membrane fusion protein (multidrug efflux system)
MISSPTKRFLAGVLLAAAVVFSTAGCDKDVKGAPTAKPTEVDVADVIQDDVPIYSDWVGTLDGFNNATIRAQVSGYLLKQNYKEGSFVKKGDLLFEIDSRQFKAALDQAEGQLAQAVAQMGKTEQDAKRYTSVPKGMVSDELVSNAVQANLVAKAAVQTAKAAVEQARLNLEFTRIVSPIDGVAGSAKAQVGDLVGPGTGELTTVSTLDPIKVTFPISEQQYMALVDRPEKGSRQLSNEKIEMVLADGSVYREKGSFYFADREVDVKTGAINIRALFPNPGNMLRPGQFCRIRAVTKIKTGALLVPQRAVNEMQGRYQIATVDGENRINLLAVKPGERVNTLWIIDEGLNPGDRVVVEGVQKIKQGQVVTLRDSAPSPRIVTVSDGNSSRK